MYTNEPHTEEEDRAAVIMTARTVEAAPLLPKAEHLVRDILLSSI